MRAEAAVAPAARTVQQAGRTARATALTAAALAAACRQAALANPAAQLSAVMGACCGKQAGPDSEIYEGARRSRLPDTEQDRQARAAAAAAVS